MLYELRIEFQSFGAVNRPESFALLAYSRNLHRYHKEMKFKSVFETQGGPQDFKWQGWSKGGKNQNPPKLFSTFFW